MEFYKRDNTYKIDIEIPINYPTHTSNNIIFSRTAFPFDKTFLFSRFLLPSICENDLFIFQNKNRLVGEVEHLIRLGLVLK